MKKILFLIILVAGNTYAQSNNVNVTFGKPNPVGDALNQVQQNANASRIARSNENNSFNLAIKNNYTEITTDLLINNTNYYKYIVLESVSGWMEKDNTKEILTILSGAKKFIILNPTKYHNTCKNIPDNLINNPEVLFLNWQREAQGDDNRITKLSVKNYKGKTIYESISKNLSFGEILKPLISNYIYSKNQALSKIEDLKKYLDLGIISKEDYNEEILKLKPILIGN